MIVNTPKRLTDYGFNCEHTFLSICIYDEELYQEDLK